MRGVTGRLGGRPVLRRRYAALKRAIVAGGPADPVAFTRAKHDWIAATLTPAWPGRRPAAPALPGRPAPHGRAYCALNRREGPNQVPRSTATVLPLRHHRAATAEDNASYSSTAAISALAASRREGKHMHNQHAGLSQLLAFAPGSQPDPGCRRHRDQLPG
jgi:hypothetical protein